MIRFGSLDFTYKEREAIQDLINQKDPQLTQGKKVYEFERAFASWLGKKYAVFVNSGTSALICALETLINEITIETTPLTYCATWNAIFAAGYEPAFRDVNNHMVLDYSEGAEQNRYYLPVHLLGKPIKGIEKLPKRNCIEDASESLGSVFRGKKLGTWGIIGAFSFYVAHQLNTIEGGMIVSDDKEIYESLRQIRDNGRICVCPICTLKTSGFCRLRVEKNTDKRWLTSRTGYNFKSTEIQAVIGLVHLSRIEENIQRRRRNYRMYLEELESPLVEEPHESIVPLAFPVQVEYPIEAICKLEKVGIETRGMFPTYKKSVYPKAYWFSENFILLPCHQEMSDIDIQYVIQKVKELSTTTG